MAKRKAGRIEKAHAEIERLRAQRRFDIIKMMAAITAIVLVIFGVAMLEGNGVIEKGNMVINGAMWLTAFVLAIFAGSAGIDFSKCGKSIQEVRNRAGL